MAKFLTMFADREGFTSNIFHLNNACEVESCWFIINVR